MPDPIWDKAAALQRTVTKLIAERCEKVSYLQYDTIAEATVAEFIDPEEFEWIFRRIAGGPPSVFITRYLKMGER